MNNILITTFSKNMLAALKSKFEKFLNIQPYLSFVVVARNDDHGGNFLYRMQIFVSALLEQIVKYHLKSELIIVEWNPPTDKPRLSDALTWSHKSNLCKIRLIEVPHEYIKNFYITINFHYLST